jgi:hemolysin III
VTPLPRPRYRGVSHELALAVVPALGLVAFYGAHGTGAHVAVAIYAVTLTGMLAASVLNHRTSLTTGWQPWLDRIDHAAINIFVAGTWTSLALLVLDGRSRTLLTAAVWGGALAACTIKFAWPAAPRSLAVAIALLLGWTGTLALPALWTTAGALPVVLMLAGGLSYTAGAIVYALRRPDPLPSTFGYHEVFHALVVLGAACHYVAIAVFIAPR